MTPAERLRRERERALELLMYFRAQAHAKVSRGLEVSQEDRKKVVPTVEKWMRMQARDEIETYTWRIDRMRDLLCKGDYTTCV